ncbi:DsrH/TusB family sulfur metabolism protein [Thalassotalea sediminis]|uniref:DsrH/TusB family sulfur metabolism protein n=1 Tax=Thalassotalea sediminis TaxID=1759089 RepID=UPI002573AB7D|nr:DsrH/TusB family sulfur metabolism protein [Thalassotalea sediminis]
MATLHLIRESALKNNFTHYLSLVNKEDGIIFLDDGCYNLSTPWLLTLNNTNITVISEHMQARGLSIPDHINQISAQQLPAQLFNYENNITWS